MRPGGPGDRRATWHQRLKWFNTRPGAWLFLCQLVGIQAVVYRVAQHLGVVG